jgi:hypothetical protein
MMSKTTALTQNTAPNGGDLKAMVDAPSSSPLSQWIFNGDDNILPGLALNYLITRSVATSDLTISVVGKNGSAFTATHPMSCWIGSTYRRATSQLTKTWNDATNWANLGAAEHATKDVDLFVYLIWNTTPATDVMDFGWSRYPGGRVYSDFSTTTTHEKYLAYANASQPAATDEVQLIGRVNATLSAGAGYTWSVPATSVIVNYPIDVSRWLAWAPTHSRSGTAYTNLPTTNTAYYQIHRDNLAFTETHTQHGTPGGTGNQRFTLPFAIPVTGSASGYNANTDNKMTVKLSSSAPTLATIAKYDGTAEVTASQIYVSTGTYIV